MSVSARIALTVVAMAAVAACDPLLLPREMHDLGRAQARWAARPFRDYSIETRSAWFCGPEIAQWTRIDVIDGVIARAVRLDTGDELEPEAWMGIETVEGLYAVLLRRPRRLNAGHQIRVRSGAGIPSYVNIDPQDDILDGGRAYYLRNARAFAGP